MIEPPTQLLPLHIQNTLELHQLHTLQLSTISSFKNAPRLIKFTSEISLFIKKITTFKTQTKLHTVLVRRNGSPYEIPQQFKEFFSNLIFKSQRIDYFLKSYKEYFKLCLNIVICSEQSNSILKTFPLEQVQSILRKSQKYLILSSLSKSSSKLSLANIKNGLKLKKDFVKALLLNKHENQSKLAQNNQYSPQLFDIEIVQIEEKINRNDEAELKTRKGGYFLVEQKICQVTKSDGSTSSMVLAKKKIKDHKKLNHDSRKLFKQLQLVKRIKNKKYLLDYYLPKNDTDCFYMNFITLSLKDLVHTKNIKMNQKFDLANQLIQAVSILHESNIVHRDLKLENILVETTNQMKLKIIDFGESQLIEKTSKNNNLGCTPPYSPIECLLNIEEQSYNRPEIDYWSIVIIIYELTFKSLPLYYNRNIQLQLVNGWRSEGDFSIFLKHRSKKGICKIEEMINLFTQQGLKINQSQRLNLKQISGMIKSIEEYYQNLQLLL